MSVDKTLDERGARYGEFIQHAEIAQGLQAVLAKMPNWPTLDYDMRQALCVICDKIARIGNGDPYYADNWHDITGYATLVERRLLSLPDSNAELFGEDQDVAVPGVQESRTVKASIGDFMKSQLTKPEEFSIEDVFNRIGKAISDKPKGYYEA